MSVSRISPGVGARLEAKFVIPEPIVAVKRAGHFVYLS